MEGSLLSINVLTKEFTFLLSKELPADKKFGTGTMFRRPHVDTPISDKDLQLSLEVFSERIIGPAVKTLADNVSTGERVRTAMLELPGGLPADRELYDGVAVRGTIGQIEGQQILRFDITIV